MAEENNEGMIEGLPEYFRPLHRLGEGGMGVVWSVRDTRVNKIGALKVIRPQSSMSEVTLQRFEREIRNFAQLVHPFIVQVFDVGKLPTGEPYIFMEEVYGKPIHANLLRGKPIHEIMLLIDRILEGLDEAHCNHIIHRDLKPDNILLTVDDTGALMPKIMDFGLALWTDERDMRITIDGMVVGTPVYMAPEQACDDHYLICPATDLYGLGCILYELFCGKPPFEGKNAIKVMTAQARETPKPFVPTPEFSQMALLAPIINRLLEKDPDRRYECAADLRAALRKYGLIRDGARFAFNALNHDGDTMFDIQPDEHSPFLSNELAPTTYKSILPEVDMYNYKYSMLSLRPAMFIGRTSAKHILEMYLHDVYNCRKAAVVLITGRPGVGKSRFIDSCTQDFYKKGTASAMKVDATKGNSLREAVYGAVFNRMLLRTLKDDQIQPAIAHFFRADSPDDPRAKKLCAIWKRLSNAPARPREENADQPPPWSDEERKLFDDIFTSLTRTRPLVMCIDRISSNQRMELLQLIRELSEGAAHSFPVLIAVINATMNDMPTDIELVLGNDSDIWLRHGITIEPMSNNDMRMLIREGLGVSEKLSPFIENISSGLPEIAVMLAQQWQLSGLLTQTADGYDSTCPTSELPIPRDVHEAILHQIYLTFSEYVGRSWIPVASLAAVCGDTFTPALLQNALGFVPTAHKLIRHSTFISLGLSGGVLRTIDESTLSFCNSLMRTALINNIDPYEVNDLHRAVARALRMEPESVDNDLRIAEHLDAAKQYYDAYEAYLVMARHSLQFGDLDSTERYIELSEKNLLLHMGFLDVRTPEMGEVFSIRAEIALGRGLYTNARQFIQQLECSCESQPQPEKQARYHLLRAKYFKGIKDDICFEAAFQKAGDFIAMLAEPLTKSQLEIKFDYLIIRVLFDASCHQEMIQIAKRLKNMVFVGKAFLAIARHSIHNQDTSKTTRILNLAIDTAHKNNDLKTEAEALYLLAKIQTDAPEVQLKTLCDALKCYESMSDFPKVAQMHCEIATVLDPWDPDTARIHAQWGSLLYDGNNTPLSEQPFLPPSPNNTKEKS